MWRHTTPILQSHRGVLEPGNPPRKCTHVSLTIWEQSWCWHTLHDVAVNDGPVAAVEDVMLVHVVLDVVRSVKRTHPHVLLWMVLTQQSLVSIQWLTHL